MTKLSARTRLSSNLRRCAAVSLPVLSLAAVAPGTATADTIPFSQLTQSHAAAPAPPSSSFWWSGAPAKIPATEHVDGIFASVPSETQRIWTEVNGYRYVGVFTNAKDAQGYASSGEMPTAGMPDASAARTCLRSRGSSPASGQQFYMYVPRPDPAKLTPAQIQRLKQMHRWPLQQPKPAKPAKPAKPPAHPTKPAEPKDPVYPVVLESLTRGHDTVTLDTTLAYVDLQTLGARLVSRSSVTLPKVADAPNGFGLFGARVEAPAASDSAAQADSASKPAEKPLASSQFLITSPRPPEDLPADGVHALEDMIDRLNVQLPSGQNSLLGCGYAQFTLSAKPGAGEMATVIGRAFLPKAHEPDEAPESEPDPDDENEVRRHETLERFNRGQRVRPMAVNVSLSQLASEQAPWLSVTYGWAGKDERVSF